MKYALSLLSFLIVCNFSFANTLIVTNTNDNGSGSLRDAVFYASPGDTIRFDPNLISNGSDTITLNSQIHFTEGVVIKGLFNSSDTLYLSGGNSNRIFYFDLTNAIEKNATVDSLVMINGKVDFGGAVGFVVADTLFVKNCIIRGNRATVDGGGIATALAYLVVKNSSIINNTANWSGGGIRADYIILNNSYINGNTAFRGTGGFEALYSALITNSIISKNTGPYGGGVSVVLDSSNLTISNSTISENIGTLGGGVYTYLPCSMIVTNTTIWGNTSTSGGGIYSRYPATIDIKNSTISHNSATNGAGVYTYADTNNLTSSISVTSSIVWSNNPSNIINNVKSTLNYSSNGHNIFSDDFQGHADPSDSVNVSASSLKLNVLAYNGGVTPTLQPDTGSIAINNGNPSDMTDAQNRAIVGRRDIGAAEYNCKVPSDSILTITACDHFEWRNGITYFSDTSGIKYTALSTTSGTCDSTYVLNLNINKVNDRTLSLIGATISANNALATYQWVDCDSNFNIIPGETNQSFTPVKNGNYAVILEENGCMDTSACVNINNIGIEENKIFSEYHIYPTPTTGLVNIQPIQQLDDITHVELYTIQGKQLYNMLLRNSKSDTFQIDLSLYPDGLYLIQLRSGNIIYPARKIIKK